MFDHFCHCSRTLHRGILQSHPVGSLEATALQEQVKGLAILSRLALLLWSLPQETLKAFCHLNAEEHGFHLEVGVERARRDVTPTHLQLGSLTETPRSASRKFLACSTTRSRHTSNSKDIKSTSKEPGKSHCLHPKDQVQLSTRHFRMVAFRPGLPLFSELRTQRAASHLQEHLLKKRNDI